MGTAAGIVKSARKNLGVTEHPPRSNYNDEIVGWYNRHIAQIGKGAWCDMSVTEEAYDSGNEVAVCGGEGKGFAYVPAHMAWGKAKYGIHHGSVPPAGAIVGYRWDGAKGTTNCDHVGVCEKSNGDGTFYSLEGNIGDAFRREHRDLTYVSCWFMPAYDNTTTEETLKTVVDLGASEAQTIKAGTRGSLDFELEYVDPGKVHTDAAKGTRYPSVFPKGPDAPYGVTVEIVLAGRPAPGVELTIASYKRDADEWERDIRGIELVGDRAVLHSNIRMSDQHKYRADVVNTSSQDVVVKRAYLFIAH